MNKTLNKKTNKTTFEIKEIEKVFFDDGERDKER